ncbi:MAG: chromosome segregation protein SMC [Nitrospinaceae bacterium]
MILKHLELTGFKSFVDATHLDFTRGFTAVVGPNGCGKSNLSDAVRWVIGEQSTKTLRGARITDLIFNGSGNRKPVHRAEVTLTLGQVPQGLRIANILNLAEEVKVTRCYHRSGESEFYINRVPCRLKDIADLFLDIGISPKVMTVIEQGHVQDIVTSRPEDRRVWIEEAAGVLKFRSRKNEALRKLEMAGLNLDRISDMVHELARQVESLKRQASKAERYRQYQGEIKHLALHLYAQKTRRYLTEAEAAGEVFEEKNTARVSLAARVVELETRAEQLKLELDALQGELNRQREGQQALKDAVRQNEHRIELRRQEIQKAEEDIAAASGEIAGTKREIETLQREAAGCREAALGVDAEIAEHQQVVTERLEEQTRCQSRLQESETQWRGAEEKVLALWHRIARIKNELTAVETRREDLQGRDAQRAQEEEVTRDQWEDTQAGETTAKTLFDEQEKAHTALKRQREEARQAAGRTRETLEQHRALTLKLREDYLARSSLLQSKQELRAQFEGYDSGVRALMGCANGDRPPGLRDVLAHIVQVPAEYETALEAVLGQRLQSLIVDSYADSAAAIRYLREHKSGRGSFIPLDSKAISRAPLYLNGNPGVIGKVADLVQAAEEYRSLLNHLLAGVVLVRDFETALHLYQKPEFQGSVVTLQGEVIDAQGVVSGGASGQTGDSLLARNRELDTLAREVQGLETELAAATAGETRLSGLAAQEDKALQALDAKVQETEIAQAGRRKDLEQLGRETSRLRRKRETLALERAAGAQEMKELAARWDNLNRSLALEEEEKCRLEEQVVQWRADAGRHREALEAINAVLHEIEVKVTTLHGRRENLLSDMQRLEDQQAGLDQRLRLRENDRTLNRGRIEEGERTIEQTAKALLDQARQGDTLAAEITTREETFRDRETLLDNTQRQSREGTRELQGLQEEIFRLETRRSEVQLQISHLEEKAFEEYSVGPEELIHQYTEAVEEETAAPRILDLREKVRRLGEVNLAALADYQAANERYLFLHQQQEDLAASIRTLHETIEKIDQTTQRLFQETFDQVNLHFQDLFARLFQGGKAQLALSDPEHPLESGIEISASPAGKSMHNISLLSGGEKTMTALSLIFALLKVRPSPFCLLDEVDAPLDEANVVRFQEILREFSAETQFILITHNQKTMSFADTLYGVTMEERGVSKVVSVHLTN